MSPLRQEGPRPPYSAKDKDATVDHLVPLADGGQHTRANVALAHNRCNWERADKGTAQLRLV
jgi:5-methylcytosine-specific restriction endonuclease McrA